MKVAIVGSRDFPNLDAVTEYIKTLDSDDVVVSGGAKGVDITAEIEAKRRGLRVEIFYPNWEKYGKSAGMIRNSLIVEHCDRLVAFQHSASRGTQNSIDKARKAGKPVEVITE